MTWSGWKTVMAGPRTSRCGVLLCAVVALLPVTGGCAGAPQPAKRNEPPARPAAESAASPAAEAPAPPRAESPAPPSPTQEITAQDRPKNEVDVVDPGGDNRPRTLVEAARAERERRAKSGPPKVEITDKNMSQHQGQITVADPKKTVSAADAAALEVLKDEGYWRNRAVDIRTRLRKASDEVKELELSAAGLRRRFYAEEDPQMRDRKIKPEWDRILQELEETRTEVTTTRKELEEFHEEGRRAGALPGWLREGSEMEPEEEKPETGPGTANPSEPQIYEQQKPPTDGR